MHFLPQVYFIMTYRRLLRYRRHFLLCSLILTAICILVLSPKTEKQSHKQVPFIIDGGPWFKVIFCLEIHLLSLGLEFCIANERQAFFTSEDTKRYKLWSCQNVCEALIYLLDNIYIRFGTKLYRQIVGIPMGTNCAPLVADLFLFCYEKDFMTSLSDVKQAEIIEAFKYLDIDIWTTF